MFGEVTIIASVKRCPLMAHLSPLLRLSVRSCPSNDQDLCFKGNGFVKGSGSKAEDSRCLCGGKGEMRGIAHAAALEMFFFHFHKNALIERSNPIWGHKYVMLNFSNWHWAMLRKKKHIKPASFLNVIREHEPSVKGCSTILVQEVMAVMIAVITFFSSPVHRQQPHLLEPLLMFVIVH